MCDEFGNFLKTIVIFIFIIISMTLLDTISRCQTLQSAIAMSELILNMKMLELNTAEVEEVMLPITKLVGDK